MRRLRISKIALGLIAVFAIGAPASFAAGESPTLTAKVIDDVVIVSAKHFPASTDVAFKATVDGGSGSATVKTSASGRALIGFEAPAEFKGTINVTAESGSAKASASITIGSTTPTTPTTSTPTTAAPATPAVPGKVPTGTIKLLPVGDSLTEGGFAGAYRKYLFPRLNAIEGTKWDFVGSRLDTVPTPDQNHEGHGGWEIAQMAPKAEEWVRQSDADVVLLHAGTNDISARRSTDQIVSDLRLFVQGVYKANPDAFVVLSKTAPRYDSTAAYDYNAPMAAFYARIPGVVEEFRAQGKSIDFVDMTVGFTEADVIADKVHLTESGHQKLSNAFYPALEKWVKGKPSTSTPSPTTPTTAAPATPAIPAAPGTTPPASGNMMPIGVPGNWTLKFSDEFNGPTLDTKKWITCYPNKGPEGCDHSNGEQQWYQPQNVAVSDGALRLTGKKETSNGYPYTSGMVTTGGPGQYTYQYGYFESRFKVPKGQGFWPALWLLPAGGGWPPEIDLMEILGHKTDEVHMTLHWGGAGKARGGSGEQFKGVDFADGWHTMGVDWQKDKITWYLDGKVARTVYSDTTNIPHEPMYLLANLAIGGTWPGNPDATTQFPQSFDVDYIRVWQ